jgi:hypothetical protein
MTARHAAPDRDRLGTGLAVGWAALHVVGLIVLGLAVDQHAVQADPRPGVFTPDAQTPSAV